MKTGLLWYDGDPRRPLEDKIGRAAERYRRKYGRWPNTCYVHAESGGDDGQDGSNLAVRLEEPQACIRVLSAPNILLHHFWLGESSEKTAGRQRKKMPS